MKIFLLSTETKANRIIALENIPIQFTPQIIKLDSGAVIVEKQYGWTHYQTRWNRKKFGSSCILNSTCITNNTKYCEDDCSQRGYRYAKNI